MQRKGCGKKQPYLYKNRPEYRALFVEGAWCLKSGYSELLTVIQTPTTVTEEDKFLFYNLLHFDVLLTVHLSN